MTLHRTSQYLLEAFDARSSGIVVFARHIDRCKISCRAVQHAFINKPLSPAQTETLFMRAWWNEKHLMLTDSAIPFNGV